MDVFEDDRRPAAAGAPMAGGHDAAAEPGRPGRPSGRTYINPGFRLTVSAAQQGPEGSRGAAQQGQECWTLPLQGHPQGGARNDAQQAARARA